MSTQSVQTTGQSSEAAQAPSAEQEFDAAFAEAVSDDSPAPASAAAQDGEGDPGQGTAGDPAPAPDAAADAPGADGNTSPQGSATDDVWANAPAELREARDRELRDWDLRFRSANGRVSALQRQLAQLQQQPQSQQPTQQQDQTQREQQPQSSGKQQGINLADPKFQQLREDFPEVAGPLLDAIADMSGQLGHVTQVAGTFEQQQTKAFLDAQENALAQAHPDWIAAASDDRFGGWLETQPIAIQEAFERNRNAIVNSQDAALVIGMFKQAVGFTAPQQNPTPAPSADPRRQRQLASARDAGRTSPPAASGIAEQDFEGAVDAWASKFAKQS